MSLCAIAVDVVVCRWLHTAAMAARCLADALRGLLVPKQKENDEPERSSLKARVLGSAPRELSFRPTLALCVGP